MKSFYLFILCTLFSTYIHSNDLITLEQLINLKQKKESLFKESKAYGELIRKAERELNQTIPSITDKEITAKTQNKQDYISIGRYWWPDSTKIDGLPYIRKDGKPNPELKNLDRQKIDRLTKGVNNLAYAYYFTDNEKYAHKAMEYLRLWFLNKNTRMNPHLQYAQVIRGYNNDNGRSEGIIDTYSFVNMIQSIKILEESSAMKPKEYNELKEWFSDFLNWLLTSDLGKLCSRAKNNHAVAYDVQVVAYALFVGREDLAKEVIAQFPEKRLHKQINPDGSQPYELERTLAMHYSIFNLNHILDFCSLAREVNTDIYSKEKSISKATSYLINYLGKEKSDFPYQQINNWNECQERLCWLMKRTMLFKPKKRHNQLLNKYCKTTDTDIRWLLYTP